MGKAKFKKEKEETNGGGGDPGNLIGKVRGEWKKTRRKKGL